MQCSWSSTWSDENPTHIPKVCGKDAVVIYVGPRSFQVNPLCKGHAYNGHWDKTSPDHRKKFTPAEYEIHRVMSE